MNKNEDNPSRREFERWASNWREEMPLERITGGEDEGDYADVFTYFAWEGWQAGAEGRQWVPVDERLPEDVCGVLVVSYRGGMTTAYRQGGGWIVCATGGILSWSPTHWMPLPELPS